MGNYGDLPEVIQLEIFSKLPAKAVGRFRALSTSWNNNLSTNYFIKKHLFSRQLTTKTNQENLALISQRRIFSIVTSPSTNQRVFNFYFETGFRCSRWRIHGSCNGLILVKLYRQHFVLFNPITFKHVKVTYTDVHNHETYGFGHDCLTDEYKIVNLATVFSYDDQEQHETFVDVFNVRAHVWRSILYPYGGGLVPSGFEGGALVNGALHWFIQGQRGGEFRRFITAFDLSTEVFREVSVPRLRSGSIGLFAVGGCLCIVDNFRKGVSHVWIMKDYGVRETWVRFRIAAEYRWAEIAAPLCFLKDGVLLCLTGWQSLYACNLETGKNQLFVLDQYQRWFNHGTAFVDSLVSPI